MVEQGNCFLGAQNNWFHCQRNECKDVFLSLSNNKHEAVTELGSNLELVDLWLLSRVFKCVCMSKPWRTSVLLLCHSIFSMRGKTAHEHHNRPR